MTARDLFLIAVMILVFCTAFLMGEVHARVRFIEMLFDTVKERISVTPSFEVKEELYRLYNELWRREFRSLFGRWALRRRDELKAKQLGGQGEASRS